MFSRPSPNAIPTGAPSRTSLYRGKTSAESFKRASKRLQEDNRQTTTFVIADDPDLVATIREMHPTNRAMQQASAYIACLIDEHPEAIYEGRSFQVEDCAAAVENMLLAITALGYATVWIDGWLRVEGRAERIGALLGLPEGKIVRVILLVGVPVEIHQQKEKKPFEERAWFNRYGGEG